MAKNFNAKVGTNPVRLSYCNFDKPRAAAAGAKEKYSCVLLIPKKDKGGYQKVLEACQEVFDNNPGIFKGYKLNSICPIHDGDGESPKGKEYPPEYKGFWVLNASNERRPKYEIKESGAVREAVDPGEEIYSGCWARVGISIYPFSVDANTGLGVSLDLVRKVKDDEPFAGTVSAADYFGDDDDDLDDDI